jgi:hypothetical protein
MCTYYQCFLRKLEISFKPDCRPWSSFSIFSEAFFIASLLGWFSFPLVLLVSLEITGIGFSPSGWEI